MKMIPKILIFKPPSLKFNYDPSLVSSPYFPSFKPPKTTKLPPTCLTFYALRFTPKESILMTTPNTPIEIYLEVGRKKTIAGAIEWPGWCRVGRNQEDALQALVEYAPRYGRVLSLENLDFQPPAGASLFVIVEQLEGSATTDFGAPDKEPAYDQQPVSDAEHQQFQSILKACWRAFDEAVEQAKGKTLRKGPRGGGRELEGIMEHVLEADRSYLSALGWKFKRDKSAPLPQSLQQLHAAILEGLSEAVQGNLPQQGPRGGQRWTPRYYVRRTAWHVLDHVWEIENRVEEP
jgi:hypothetical protein